MAKILLVEDDKNLREVYGLRLQAEGYQIVSAGDGEEALAMAIKEQPNLIISDVMMPKISGFDMLDILRSTTETKDVKVIMMTALSSDDQRARGESLGADRYLVKSQVGIEDVVRTVHEVLADGVGGPAPAAVPSIPPTPEPAAMPVPTPPAMPAPEVPINPEPAPVASMTPPVINMPPEPAPVAFTPPAPLEPIADTAPLAPPQPAAPMAPPTPPMPPMPAPEEPFSLPVPSTPDSFANNPMAGPSVMKPLDLSAAMDAELNTAAPVAAPYSEPAPQPAPAPIEPMASPAPELSAPDQTPTV